MSLESGSKVGRWVVGPRIGRGGMAVVHQVTHAELGSRAALKVLHTTDPRVQQRLMREGRAQGRLEHPNIVRVHDVIEVGGQTALILELVDGPDLGVWARSAERAPSEIVAVLRALASALALAHRAGVVHRDLKPGNVLMAGGAIPKVSDFGIAKLLDDGDDLQTRSGTMLGTPAYMAPEQIRNAGAADARADVWALGVIGYELLAGERPFPAGHDLIQLHQDAMAGTYVGLDVRRPDLPAEVVAAVHGALQGPLDARLPSMDAFLAALDGQASSGLATSIRVDPLGLVEGYALEQVLVDGPVARSWRGRSPSGEPALIKGLRVRQASPKEIELARREADVLGQLAHPAIPALLGAFEAEFGGEPHFFVARAWVDGESLAAERTHRRYDEQDVLAVLEEVSGVLAYLHGLHPPIVHRDLRPENLIRRRDGSLALVDFGAVRDAFQPTLGGQTVAGRFGYMAPEQFGGDASPASDAWGLGALAVFLLGRKDPRELMDERAGLRWRDTVRPSAPVDTLLEGLLEPEAGDRVANAGEALRAVRRARKQLVTFAERPAPALEGLGSPEFVEHLPPVLHQAQQPAPSQGRGVAVMTASATVAMVVMVLGALAAIVAIVGAVLVTGPEASAPPPVAAPPEGLVQREVRYTPTVVVPGEQRLDGALTVTDGEARVRVELLNGSGTPVVFTGAEMHIGADSAPTGPHEPELALPGGSTSLRWSVADDGLRSGERVSIVPTAFKLDATTPVVEIVPLARHLEADGLSCTVLSRNPQGFGERLDGMTCDWTGEGWLLVDGGRAAVVGRAEPLFRGGLEAVPPGGSFVLGAHNGSGGLGDPFAGGLELDLTEAVRRADAHPLALDPIVFEAVEGPDQPRRRP